MFGLSMKVAYGSVLAATAFYISGCSTPPRRSSDVFDYNFEMAKLRSAMPAQQRYEIERKEYERKDLIHTIDPELVRVVKDAQSTVESAVDKVLPSNPKIKKSKLVWEMSWEELRNKLTSQ